MPSVMPMTIKEKTVVTGYHWGMTRKRAILGWERGVTAPALNMG